ASEADADGTMTLPLATGTYRFSASAERYGSHTITADVPSGEVRIALPRGGTLALPSTSDVHAKAGLNQPRGDEYVRCWRNGVEGGRSRSELRLGETAHPPVVCGPRSCCASPGGRFLPLVGMTRDVDGDCQPHILPRDFRCKAGRVDGRPFVGRVDQPLSS